MRYKASEKREIIDLVERSPLPVLRTLDRIGTPRATFSRWYHLYRRRSHCRPLAAHPTP